MPDKPPRLFLSYGVRDASEVAERLHHDLTARHYQIWQDIRRIRIGWPWDEEVQAGLRNSQVLLVSARTSLTSSPHFLAIGRQLGWRLSLGSHCLPSRGCS